MALVNFTNFNGKAVFITVKIKQYYTKSSKLAISITVFYGSYNTIYIHFIKIFNTI